MIIHLTDKEKQLLELYIVYGRYKIVAEKMDLALSTVKNMAAGIIHGYEVNSIGQACVLYDRAVRRRRD